MNLQIQNHGQLIIGTNFWKTDFAAQGLLFISFNAGAARMLLPRALQSEIIEFKACNEVVISRGTWNDVDSLEVMFEDNSDSPFAVHVRHEQADRMPTEVRRDDLTFTCWVEPRRSRQPHLVLTKPCRYRRVPRLPCLKPFLEQQ